MEKTGILLTIDNEKSQIQINDIWFPYEPALLPSTEWLGHLVRARLGDEGQVGHLELQSQKLREIKGKIQSQNLSIPRISMHFEGQLVHFYVPPHLFKMIKNRLKPGMFLRFQFYEYKLPLNKNNYYVIARLLPDAGKKREIHNNPELKKILPRLKRSKYYAFMDLEFSMTGSEYQGKTFVPEIIQAGIIVTNEKGVLVEKFSSYILPTLHPVITSRTKDFLKIGKGVVSRGMPYLEFYKIVKDLQEKFDPVFMVWGVSDGQMLKNSYEANQVEPLFRENQVINLQNIHRLYFEIGQDIGLYNAIKSYGLSTGVQIHDAMVDAAILSQIFFQFLQVLDRKKQIPFKENYERLLARKTH